MRFTSYTLKRRDFNDFQTAFKMQLALYECFFIFIFKLLQNIKRILKIKTKSKDKQKLLFHILPCMNI